MELAVWEDVSIVDWLCGHPDGKAVREMGDSLSTSFLVYVSLLLLSWMSVTTWRRSSSLSFCRPSASFSMST